MLEAHDTVAREHLRPGEALLWSGGPDPSKLFAPGDVFFVPFSILWCAFAVFWTTTAGSHGAPPFFTLFGTVFVLIGLYMTVGRFFAKRLRHRRSTYAVTDRRVFAVVGRREWETPLAGTPRTLDWSADRKHLSVTWGAASAAGGFFGSRQGFPVNAGFDGILGPVPTAFFDVRDGEALAAALDRTPTAAY